MKKILLIIISILSVSCSDELTKSQAEKIIEQCLEQNPEFGKVKINFENMYLQEGNWNTDFFKEIESQGLIKMTLDKRMSIGQTKVYKIEFTEKSKDLELPSTGSFMDDRTVVKTYEYKLEKVKEIQEIPDLNGARVVVVYSKINKTPFYEYNKRDTLELVTKTIGLRKTTDGWKYCK